MLISLPSLWHSMVQDKRDVAFRFRSRLAEAMEREGMSKSHLASLSGIDRSTLSQLMSPDAVRLPRADTAAAMATALTASLDWLLGLSQETRSSAGILKESFEITPFQRTPVDENLARWHEEATGYKIRYVPTNLPDLMVIEPVLRHEFRDYVVKTSEQAIATRDSRLAHSRMPDADLEICMSLQTWESFAHGEGIWRGLAPEHRIGQLDAAEKLLEELYPSLRLYLYDGLRIYSAPVTVFGPKRAAIYIGQSYFVFNTTEHIRSLIRHFDDLIRVAAVPATGAAAFLRNLRAAAAKA